jgi:FkbM family methyltransferase
LGLAVNESKDDEDLFFRSIKIISKELRAVRAAIFVVSEDLKMLKVKSLINGNYETTSEKYIEESVIVSSITQNKILHHESYVVQNENLGPDVKFIFGPYIIIPMLFSDGKPFGAISISEPEDKTPFTSNQLRLLLTISSQFVKGYENIKLNRDMLAKKAMEKEIEITRNIQNNGFSGVIESHGIIAWSAQTLVNFPIPDLKKFDSWGSYGVEPLKSSKERLLKTNTIYFIVNNRNVSVIKLDIQGSEFNALQGCLQTITKSKPVIIFEFEHKLSLSLGVTFKDYLNLIESYDYKFLDIRYPNFIVGPK